MSVTGRDITRNQGAFDRSTEKIFIWNNEYISGTFLNDSGAELTLVGGELLGRVSATGKIIILKSAASDGSQFPLGINKSCITLAIAGEAEISLGVAGDVDQGLVILDGSDTLETPISLIQIRDRIAGDTKGIQLVESEDLTKLDN